MNSVTEVVRQTGNPATTNCTRMPLRIGILMDHPSPHMVALLEAVAAREDCTLEVVYCGKSSPQRDWESAAGRISHQFIDGVTGPLSIRFNPGILRTINLLRTDIWIINTIYGSLTTLIAAAWLKSQGKLWIYMNEPVRPRPGLCGFLKEFPLKFVLKRADGIIGTGKRAVEMYRSYMREDCPAESVPYFINLSDFLKLSAPVAPANGQDLQFVTSCQMIKRKGIDCLLRACENLPDSGWHLTLVGKGPLKSSLEREFGSLILRKRVSFVGAIPYLQRAMAFHNRHVFLFPSRWDGWGMVLPEALASGLPVISTDRVTSAHEFIRDDVNGFMVPADNPGALAEKMLWFIENTTAFARMSSEARKSVENYKPALGAETLLAFIQRLVDSDPLRQSWKSYCLKPEQAEWSLLTKPSKPAPKATWLLRRTGKDVYIRGNLAMRRPKRAKGNLILAYHLVLKEDRARFEDHLRFFSDYFKPVSLPELLRVPASGDRDDCRIAITFDDGFRLLMQDCLELLEKHRIKASFYIPAAFINVGLQNGRTAEFSRRSFYYNHPLEPMHPDDLKKLTALGHEIGSHGLFHTSVHSMLPQSARKEIAASRSMISEWTGSAPNGFSYPYGDSSNTHENPADWLKEAGFTYGLMLARGCVDQSTKPFEIPRHHVEGNWPIHALRYFLLV
jgi:glycosyltransferase involved in cell wall biosynthesis/peptidoglycan/xylan/chitin deacetylase (PgdA/CDA1 family)